MDLQKVISDLVPKLTGNTDLIAKFTSNPLEAIKDLLGIKGVQSALGSDASEALAQGKSILDKVKGIFSK